MSREPTLPICQSGIRGRVAERSARLLLRPTVSPVLLCLSLLSLLCCCYSRHSRGSRVNARPATPQTVPVISHGGRASVKGDPAVNKRATMQYHDACPSL